MSKKQTRFWAAMGLIVLVLCAVFGPGLAHELLAQQSAGPQSLPKASTASTAPPSIPVEQIIQKFAAREAEFKEARGNYTYSQSFDLKAWLPDGQLDGEYRMDSDIIFTPDGKRLEKVTYAPQNTLQYLQITEEDLDDIVNVMPFVLTSADLPKYNIEYAGRERVDELNTYVFRVSPKSVEKGVRGYFEGTVWVDDEDLQIVKAAGKSIHFLKPRKGQTQLFPHFETYREQVDGQFWFPTYTRVDDTLNFPEGASRIHAVVRYTNYKRFTSTIRILREPPKKQP